jgi:hypothetical protein
MLSLHALIANESTLMHPNNLNFIHPHIQSVYRHARSGPFLRMLVPSNYSSSGVERRSSQKRESVGRYAREAIIIAYILFAMSACVGRSTGAEATLLAIADARVYESFLESARGLRQGDTLYVTETSISFRLPQPNRPNLLQQFDSLPSSLITGLEVESARRRPTRDLFLPYPTHILLDKEMKAIFSAGLVEGWKEFYRLYPLTKAYLSFSPVVYTEDGRSALFYIEYACGSLCGEALAVVVQRDDEGRWKLRKAISFWIT